MRQQTWVTSTLCCLVLAWCGALTAADATQDATPGWQAGVATVCITPTGPMPMAGYFSRTAWPSKTIHDLWAKALVLRDGRGEYAVLITLDLLGIARDLSVPICQRIERAYGIPRAAIAICTSHTHTGPVVGRNAPICTSVPHSPEAERLIDDYAQFLRDQIPSLVDEALKDLRPVRLRYATGRATFAVNRRNNREADVPTLREHDALKGPVDHDVPVLAVTGDDGQLRAVVAGYACHATVLSDVAWSSDWPGFGQTEIEKRHPDTVALYWAGCGGDQNPLPRRSIALAQAYGNQFADSVDRALTAQMVPISPELQCSYREIKLPYAQPPSRAEFEKEAQGTGPTALRAKMLLAQWDRAGTIDDGYPHYPIQRWQLGQNVEWIFLGGEVVVDYALRLKSTDNTKSTWVAGYSNDVMAYIPSRRVLLEGGYEGRDSMLYYGLPGAWHESIERWIRDAIEQARSSTKVRSPRNPGDNEQRNTPTH